MMPLHPTNAPATTKALLASIKPAADVLKPDRELRKLIETGMSPEKGKTSWVRIDASKETGNVKPAFHSPPPIAMTEMTP